MRNLASLLVSTAFVAGCAGISEPPSQPDQAAVASMVAGTMQALTQAAPSPQAAGVRAEFSNVSLVIPADVAEAALAGAIPASTDPEATAPWDIAPAYIKFVLDGYRQFGSLHEPQIRIYPAQEFIALETGAQESIQRLQGILAGGPPDAENLPFIPFFNAADVFAAQMQVVPFANGSGLRTITEYAQYPAPANNEDLFYHFQGLTDDGRYYIIAILPISISILAADASADAYVPDGGVAYPSAPDVESLRVYYTAVMDTLNAAQPGDFSPPLSSLDSMMQSLLVAGN